MVEAAKLANYLEHPTNRLLTIRTSGMVLAGEGGVLRHHMPAERIIDYLDRHTRWCKQRDFRSHHIWVREFGAHHNDHFHMGFHMPPELDQAYITQVTNWLEEGVRSISGNTADLATSELNSWNIRRCLKGDTTGKNIARYLGKSEPNAYLDGWGRHRKNKQKLHPKRSATGMGPIEGTAKHDKRWGTSRNLARMQMERHSYALSLCH
jgi:hypothetical protein